MLIEEIKRIIPDYLVHCKTVDARYKLITKLGEGRYGKVYLCFDLHFESLVAMKTLRKNNLESSLKNFMNEVLTATRISSVDSALKTPRIIDFNLNGSDEFGETIIYYIMEFIALGELYAVLEPIDFISERLACFLFRQICDNLIILHSNNLLHLDLKPENVLVDMTGNLYLCDFGNSAFIVREEQFRKADSVKKTEFPTNADFLKSSIDSNKLKRQNQHIKKNPKVQTDALKKASLAFSATEFNYFLRNTKFVVTSEYAAPEIADFENFQELAKKKSDIKNNLEIANPYKLDVFSLGVLLFHVIMKSRPFDSASAMDEYYKRFLQNREAFWKIFSKIRTVSKEFKEIISDTLEVSNKNRFDIMSLYNHNWMLRHFPTEDQYLKTYIQITSFKRSNIKYASQNCGKGSPDASFQLNDQQMDSGYSSGKNSIICGKSNENKASGDSNNLAQELHQILTARRLQILETIKDDLIRKEQRQKSKRYKFNNPFKSEHTAFINEFLQKNQPKLAALKFFLSNDSSQESFESLFSSGSESSSVSGDCK